MADRTSFRPTRLAEVFDALLAAHGPQRWWPADSAFEVLVGAFLVQRTAWSNAERALNALKQARALDPAVLAGAGTAELEQWIRPAGFYRQKAARLRAASRWLLDAGGMEAVARLDDASLRRALLALHGVGAETADAIALYAFARPRFVVDAYARRLFARLQLIDGDEPYEALRRAFEAALPPDSRLLNEYHALIVAHGKDPCRARPRCAACTLRSRCAYAAARPDGN